MKTDWNHANLNGYIFNCDILYSHIKYIYIPVKTLPEQLIAVYPSPPGSTLCMIPVTSSGHGFVKQVTRLMYSQMNMLVCFFTNVHYILQFVIIRHLQFASDISNSYERPLIISMKVIWSCWEGIAFFSCMLSNIKWFYSD